MMLPEQCGHIVAKVHATVTTELRVFIDGKDQGYSFRTPKKYKPAKQAFWCPRNLHGIVWNSGHLD